MVGRWGGVWVAWIVLLGLVLPLPGQVRADPPDPAGVLLPPLTQEWGTTIAPCYAGCGGVLVPAANEAYEQRMVELVNAERVARGLPPLKRAAGLNAAARYHAADMGQDDYFDHNTFDRNGGALTLVCDTWSRIGSYYSGACGETVAAGYASPEDVVAGWMASDGHRAVMLSTASWELGAGYYGQGGEWDQLWTLDFGRQAGVYPLIINDEAAQTDCEQVSLYVYGTWDEIRLRNDGGAWSDWQPFQNRLSWTLRGEVGDRTVTAEMRGPAGLAASSDTIDLTRATIPALGNLPQSVTFLYSITERTLVPPAVVLRPTNTATADVLTWRVDRTGTWYSATPNEGTTPEALTITPAGFDTSRPATYRGTLLVTVTSPAGVLGSPHTIDLSLEVVGPPITRVHLPLLVHAP